MPALAAGYGNFAYIVRKFQPCAALGAVEIFVFLAVFEAVFGLTDICADAASECKELLIFLGALFNIFGKDAEECPDIENKSDSAENGHSGEYCDYIQRKTGPNLYAGKLVTAVATVHESAEGVLYLLPH